jgi:glycosyltransferase involved in cell wall biosynthesis
MNIVFIRTNFYWYDEQAGGSVAHIAGFVEGVNHLGHTLSFISTDRLKKIDTNKNPVHVVSPPQWQRRLPYLGEFFYNYTMIPRVKAILKEQMPDVLYQRHSAFNIVGAVVSKQLKIPLVLEYNSPEGWKLRHWNKTSPLKQKVVTLISYAVDALEKFSLRRAASIVVVSSALKDRLVEQGIPAEKVLVNPNGVDIENFDAVKPADSMPTPEGNLSVGFVGTFAHWHGAEVLCKSLAEVITEVPKTHVILIGDGVYKKECEEIVTKAGLKDSVTFTGRVEHNNAVSLLKRCDVLVSPHVPNTDASDFFGSPMKLFEYMATGNCIVASDLAQIGEVLGQYEAGILVKPGDHHDLAKGIIKALKEPALRKSLGERARKAVVKDYSWDANAARVIAVAQKLLKI